MTQKSHRKKTEKSIKKKLMNRIPCPSCRVQLYLPDVRATGCCPLCNTKISDTQHHLTTAAPVLPVQPTSKATTTTQQNSKMTKRRIIAMLIQDAGRHAGHAAKKINSAGAAPTSSSRWSNTNVTEICPGLFLGDINVALDRTFLREKNISHVVNCTTEIPNVFAKSNMNVLNSMGYPIETIYDEEEVEIQYLQLNLVDVESEIISCHFQETFNFLNKILGDDEEDGDSSVMKTNDTSSTSSSSSSRRARGNVLVHCAQGVSRSATIVASYLMRKENMSCNDALAFIKYLRPVSGPNDGFRTQLKQLEEELKIKNDDTVAVAQKK